jgi:SAM-dependent methyltransferase
MFKEIFCAVCRSNNYRVKYPEHINYSGIDFSPRRQPSKNHCRLVQCKRCGLIYANPIFNDDYILQLYRNSVFINEKQVELMAEDYLDQLKKASLFFKNRNNLLEIGCGNGCFLMKAKKFGFKNVYGVEPCKDSVAQAEEEVAGNIINDVFKAGLYKDNFFDVVCAIQIFDHLIAPNDVLKNIYKVIKENGYLLIISHNVKFILTKILGERSPMYDIEHIYLFDRITIKKLLEDNGFRVIYAKNMMSRYTLGHILKMLPLAGSVRIFFTDLISRLGLINKEIKVMGGNMVALAKKIKDEPDD